MTRRRALVVAGQLALSWCVPVAGQVHEEISVRVLSSCEPTLRWSEPVREIRLSLPFPDSRQLGALQVAASPDGEWVAFLDSPDRLLIRVYVSSEGTKGVKLSRESGFPEWGRISLLTGDSQGSIAVFGRSDGIIRSYSVGDLSLTDMSQPLRSDLREPSRPIGFFSANDLLMEILEMSEVQRGAVTSRLTLVRRDLVGNSVKLVSGLRGPTFVYVNGIRAQLPMAGGVLPGIGGSSTWLLRSYSGHTNSDRSASRNDSLPCTRDPPEASYKGRGATCGT